MRYPIHNLSRSAKYACARRSQAKCAGYFLLNPCAKHVALIDFAVCRGNRRKREDIVGRAPLTCTACSSRNSLVVHAAIKTSLLANPDSASPRAVLAKSTSQWQSAPPPMQSPERDHYWATRLCTCVQSIGMTAVPTARAIISAGIILSDSRLQDH